jgi:hypothetical protein
MDKLIYGELWNIFTFDLKSIIFERGIWGCLKVIGNPFGRQC